MTEGEVPGKREPDKGGSLLRKICQGVVVGIIVGVAGSLLVHATGLGSPPVWVFVIAGAVAALACDLIVQRVRRASQRGG